MEREGIDRMAAEVELRIARTNRLLERIESNQVKRNVRRAKIDGGYGD